MRQIYNKMFKSKIIFAQKSSIFYSILHRILLKFMKYSAQFTRIMGRLAHTHIPEITPFFGIQFRKSRRFWELPQENDNFAELDLAQTNEI